MLGDLSLFFCILLLWSLFTGTNSVLTGVFSVFAEKKDEAGCFQSKAADEEACVAVKIEHSTGRQHRHLHYHIFYFEAFHCHVFYFEAFLHSECRCAT